MNFRPERMVIIKFLGHTTVFEVLLFLCVRLLVSSLFPCVPPSLFPFLPFLGMCTRTFHRVLQCHNLAPSLLANQDYTGKTCLWHTMHVQIGLGFELWASLYSSSYCSGLLWWQTSDNHGQTYSWYFKGNWEKVELIEILYIKWQETEHFSQFNWRHFCQVGVDEREVPRSLSPPPLFGYLSFFSVYFLLLLFLPSLPFLLECPYLWVHMQIP